MNTPRPRTEVSAPSPHRRIGPLVAAVALVATAGTAPATAAQITSFQLDRSLSFSQSGDGQASPSSALFEAVAFTDPAGALTSGSLAYPGSGSPAAFSASGNELSVVSFLPSASSLDAAYPLGVYTATAGGPGGTATSTIDNTVAPFPDTPYLSGTTYSSLQGMDPTQPFTVNLSPFGAGQAGWTSVIGFSLVSFDGGGSYMANFSSPTASFVIPADSLRSGFTYSFTLVYDTHILPSTTTGIGYQALTSGSFATGAGTAVAEPAGLALLGTGLAVLFGLRRLRRGRGSVAA